MSTVLGYVKWPVPSWLLWVFLMKVFSSLKYILDYCNLDSMYFLKKILLTSTLIMPKIINRLVPLCPHRTWRERSRQLCYGRTYNFMALICNCALAESKVQLLVHINHINVTDLQFAVIF